MRRAKTPYEYAALTPRPCEAIEIELGELSLQEFTKIADMIRVADAMQYAGFGYPE